MTILILSVIIIIAIAFLLGFRPKFGELVRLPLRYLKNLNGNLIKRKGLIWTILMWWTVGAVVIIILIFRSALPFLRKIEYIFLTTFLTLAFWDLRARFRLWQQRLNELPKRERKQ